MSFLEKYSFLVTVVIIVCNLYDFALLLCLQPEKESGIFYGTTSSFAG